MKINSLLYGTLIVVTIPCLAMHEKEKQKITTIVTDEKTNTEFVIMDITPTHLQDTKQSPIDRVFADEKSLEEFKEAFHLAISQNDATGLDGILCQLPALFKEMMALELFDGLTMLQEAARLGACKGIFTVLLRYHANINKPDGDGNTSIHYAAKAACLLNQPMILVDLLSAAAEFGICPDLTIKNKKKKLPLAWLVQQRTEVISEWSPAGDRP